MARNTHPPILVLQFVRHVDHSLLNPFSMFQQVPRYLRSESSYRLCVTRNRQFELGSCVVQPIRVHENTI